MRKGNHEAIADRCGSISSQSQNASVVSPLEDSGWPYHMMHCSCVVVSSPISCAGAILSEPYRACPYQPPFFTQGLVFFFGCFISVPGEEVRHISQEHTVCERVRIARPLCRFDFFPPSHSGTVPQWPASTRHLNEALTFRRVKHQLALHTAGSGPQWQIPKESNPFMGKKMER